MKIPLFPLETVLFPGTALPLHIFEDSYREMIGECLAEKKAFGVVRAQQESLALVGCTAKIVRVLERYPDGRLYILCEGAQRFEIESLDESRSFLQADVDFFQDEGAAASRPEREECAALHFETLHLAGYEGPVMHLDLSGPVAFQLADALPSDLGFKQQLLGSRSDAERTAQLKEFYEEMLPRLRTAKSDSGAARSWGPVA